MNTEQFLQEQAQEFWQQQAENNAHERAFVKQSWHSHAAPQSRGMPVRQAVRQSVGLGQQQPGPAPVQPTTDYTELRAIVRELRNDLARVVRAVQSSRLGRLQDASSIIGRQHAQALAAAAEQRRHGMGLPNNHKLPTIRQIVRESVGLRH